MPRRKAAFGSRALSDQKQAPSSIATSRSRASAVQTVAALLPFRWMISFPVELLLGNLTPQQTAIGFAAQAAWIALALILLRLVWRAGVRVYSAVSG